jgi:hypothetical protein
MLGELDKNKFERKYNAARIYPLNLIKCKEKISAIPNGDNSV